MFCLPSADAECPSSVNMVFVIWGGHNWNHGGAVADLKWQGWKAILCITGGGPHSLTPKLLSYLQALPPLQPNLSPADLRRASKPKQGVILPGQIGNNRLKGRW